jgi:hypothetical protein
VPLLTFICLQCLDALTTVVFLRFGIHEGNPLVRMALAAFARPEAGVIAPKLFAMALGVFAWRTGRTRLLWRMNLLFAACVAWNVVAIVTTACA